MSSPIQRNSSVVNVQNMSLLDLNDDMINYILMILAKNGDCKTLAHLSQTCKSFKKFCDSKTIWSEVFRKVTAYSCQSIPADPKKALKIRSFQLRSEQQELFSMLDKDTAVCQTASGLTELFYVL